MEFAQSVVDSLKTVFVNWMMTTTIIHLTGKMEAYEMLWFTSDWHLFHERILELSHRPFKDVKEMNETILTNMDVIKEGDTLYFLGDGVCGVGADKLKMLHEIFFKIATRGVFVHFIRGNHDPSLKRLEESYGPFESIQEMKTIRVQPKHEDGDLARARDIVLCHYPLEHWEFEANGTYHLHAHTHLPPNKAKTSSRRRLDIGVDGHDFRPWSLDEVVATMRGPFTPLSHHV